jgi:hypothetical protein
VPGREANDVIRYVDSAGWTWEVCELADLDTPTRTHPGADARPPAPPAARRDGALAIHPAPADSTLAAPDDLPAAGELYFLSRVGTRKLHDYPSAWFALSRDGLEELCDRATDVSRR